MGSAVKYIGFHEPIVFSSYITTRKARKNPLTRKGVMPTGGRTAVVPDPEIASKSV
jgi:hypothetical protein